MKGASFTLSDVRQRLGTVVEHGPRDHEAFDAVGKSLGQFATRKAATAAIPSPVNPEARS